MWIIGVPGQRHIGVFVVLLQLFYKSAIVYLKSFKKVKKILQFLYRYLCRKGLSQKSWAAQILHIPKKGLCLGLDLGQLMGVELWALELILLDKCFDMSEALNHRYLLDQIIYAKSVIYGEHLILFRRAGVWVPEVSNAGYYMPNVTDSQWKAWQQGSGELPWSTTLCTYGHFALLLRKLLMSMWLPWGRTFGSLCFVSPRLCPHGPFFPLLILICTLLL